MEATSRNGAAVNGEAEAMPDETVAMILEAMTGFAGPFPEAVCEEFGATPDGKPGPGGYTGTARVFAAEMGDLVRLAALKRKAKRLADAGCDARQAEGGNILQALGLVGPLRAAVREGLRAGAQRLAAALQDGAADDHGLRNGDGLRSGDELPSEKDFADGEMWLILRCSPVGGADAPGGGVPMSLVMDSSGDMALSEARQMLEAALVGVRLEERSAGRAEDSAPDASPVGDDGGTGSPANPSDGGGAAPQVT